MENIGKKLREQREQLGLTIEEVSARTRLTIKHIKAIEAGDISYFKDDLSYLRFFLRSYCNALGIDFEDIKDDLRETIDEYTESFSIETIRVHREIEQNVRKKADKVTTPRMQEKERPRRIRRKIDVSMLSFIAIVLVIIACLVYAFYVFIIQDQEKEPVVEQPPIQDIVETPKVPEETKEPEPVEETLPFAITKVSDNEYTLENLKTDDAIDIEVTFGSYSQFSALLDGTVLSEPVSKVYNYNEVVHVKQTAKANAKITLAFGYMQNNKISINGIAVELPATVANKAGAVTLDFVVKGE